MACERFWEWACEVRAKICKYFPHILLTATFICALVYCSIFSVGWIKFSESGPKIALEMRKMRKIYKHEHEPFSSQTMANISLGLDDGGVDVMSQSSRTHNTNNYTTSYGSGDTIASAHPPTEPMYIDNY